MSIASAITAAQGRVADAYTAVSNMGGTLPATQNLTNLPTAINSIPAGEGADIVTVVNNTDFDVVEGEKVWLSGPSQNSLEIVDFDSKKQNFDTTGTITITDGVASGFSTTDYIQSKTAIDLGSTDFEINYKIRPTQVSAWQCILANEGGQSFRLAINAQGKLSFGVGNGSAWDNADVYGNTSLQANVVYYVKVIKTGNTFQSYLSTSGIQYTLEGTYVSSSLQNTPVKYNVGISRNFVDPFSGDIYLTESYIKTPSGTLWEPFIPSVDEESFTGVANESIASGSTGEVKVLFPKNYNFAIVGNPSIDTVSGELTGLTANDYIYIEDAPQNVTSYEIVMKVKTPANNTALNEKQYIIGNAINAAYHSPIIETNVRRIEARHPKTSSSSTSATSVKWQNSEADWAYDTDAWIKLTWNGTTFEMLRSLDGSTWTSCGAASATTLYWDEQLTIGFGGTSTTSGYLNTIYLKDCYININGKRWWNAFKAG